MLLMNDSVFAKNFYVAMLAKNWLEDQTNAKNIEFEIYLSILETLGKSN